MKGNGNGSGTKAGDGIKAQRSREIEEIVARLDWRDSQYLRGELDYLNGTERQGACREKGIDDLVCRLYCLSEELLELGIRGESYEASMLDQIINSAQHLLRFSGAENQRRYFEWTPNGNGSGDVRE
jgi:hypothetical protein